MSSFEYYIEEDRVFFKIKFNKERIQYFKTIPNYWWHSEEKEWSFPLEFKDEIIAKLSRYPELDSNFKSSYGKDTVDTPAEYQTKKNDKVETSIDSQKAKNFRTRVKRV